MISVATKSPYAEATTHPEPVMTLETVTPEMARLWLGQNLKNRHPRPPHVSKIVRDILAGAWTLIGDPIRFDWGGVLIDGQNRLMAVIEADRPIRTYVIRGLAPATRDQVDSGISRSLSDVLTMRGEKGASTLAAAIAACIRWDTGDIADKAAVVSRAEALAWLADNPGIRDAVREGESIRKAVQLPGSIGSAFVFHAVTLAPSDAETFVDLLISGADLTAGDPILCMRHWLIRRRAITGHTTPGYFYLAILIKAWNAWMDGRKLQQLLWRRGGAGAESFPVMRGADDA